MKVILAARGQARREVELSEVRVPDLWHIATDFGSGTKESTLTPTQKREVVLECWHLAHDLLANLQSIESGQPL